MDNLTIQKNKGLIASQVLRERSEARYEEIKEEMDDSFFVPLVRYSVYSFPPPMSMESAWAYYAKRVGQNWRVVGQDLRQAIGRSIEEAKEKSK